MATTTLRPLLLIAPFWLGMLWVSGAAAQGLTALEARHLLARTSLGVTESTLNAFVGLPREEAVDRLLKGVRTEPVTTAPEWVDEPPPGRRRRESMSEEERTQFRRQVIERVVELKSWWYREMLATPSPLTERMTLFWSNHFTSSLEKVRWPPLLHRQNLLLRRLAFTDLRSLLREISRDPAMLVYLDNALNRRDAPNENYARELLELFTLGEGHYTEADIRETARAFTGWTLDRDTAEFEFRRRWHDRGRKTVLGRSGHLDGDDVIEIILAQPRTAEHITEKLWREFVSPEPQQAEVDRLAEVFSASDYEIRGLMRALLLSDHFWAQANRGTLVKSPVELLVGAVSELDLPLRDPRILVRAGRAMGQDLFAPPSVKGWPGGTAWLDSNTLLIRQQAMQRVAGAGERMASSTPLGQGQAEALQERLLPLPPVDGLSLAENRAGLLAKLLRDPVYQLK